MANEGRGAQNQCGTPPEMVEEPEGLVREAPQEDEWAGPQAPDREGQVGAQQPLLLPQ